MFARLGQTRWSEPLAHGVGRTSGNDRALGLRVSEKETMSIPFIHFALRPADPFLRLVAQWYRYFVRHRFVVCGPMFLIVWLRQFIDLVRIPMFDNLIRSTNVRFRLLTNIGLQAFRIYIHKWFLINCMKLFRSIQISQTLVCKKHHQLPPIQSSLLRTHVDPPRGSLLESIYSLWVASLRCLVPLGSLRFPWVSLLPLGLLGLFTDFWVCPK